MQTNNEEQSLPLSDHNVSPWCVPQRSVLFDPFDKTDVLETNAFQYHDVSDMEVFASSPDEPSGKEERQAFTQLISGNDDCENAGATLRSNTWSSASEVELNARCDVTKSATTTRHCDRDSITPNAAPFLPTRQTRLSSNSPSEIDQFPVSNYDQLQLAVAMRAYLEAFCHEWSLQEYICRFSSVLSAVFKSPLVLSFFYDASTDELVTFVPPHTMLRKDTSTPAVSNQVNLSATPIPVLQQFRVSSRYGFVAKAFRCKTDSEWKTFVCPSAKKSTSKSSLLLPNPRTLLLPSPLLSPSARLTSPSDPVFSSQTPKNLRPALSATSKRTTLPTCRDENRVGALYDDTLLANTSSLERAENDAETDYSSFNAQAMASAADADLATFLQLYFSRYNQLSRVGVGSQTSVQDAKQHRETSIPRQTARRVSTIKTQCLAASTTNVTSMVSEHGFNATSCVLKRPLKASLTTPTEGSEASDSSLPASSVLALLQPLGLLDEYGRCRRLSAVLNVVFGGFAAISSPRDRKVGIKNTLHSALQDDVEQRQLTLALFGAPLAPSILDSDVCVERRSSKMQHLSSNSFSAGQPRFHSVSTVNSSSRHSSVYYAKTANGVLSTQLDPTTPYFSADLHKLLHGRQGQGDEEFAHRRYAFNNCVKHKDLSEPASARYLNNNLERPYLMLPETVTDTGAATAPACCHCYATRYKCNNKKCDLDSVSWLDLAVQQKQRSNEPNRAVVNLSINGAAYTTSAKKEVIDGVVCRCRHNNCITKVSSEWMRHKAMFGKSFSDFSLDRCTQFTLNSSDDAVKRQCKQRSVSEVGTTQNDVKSVRATFEISSFPVLCRPLFSVERLKEKTPIGVLCIFASSANDTAEPELQRKLLDHVAHQTQAVLRCVKEQEALNQKRHQDNVLLQFHRNASKDVNECQKTVALLLELIKKEMNAAEVALFVPDFKSNGFICCAGNTRCLGLKFPRNDPLLGPCFTSKRVLSWFSDGTARARDALHCTACFSTSTTQRQETLYPRFSVPELTGCVLKGQLPFCGEWQKQQTAILLSAGSINLHYDMVAQDIVTRSSMCVPLISSKGTVLAIVNVINRFPPGFRMDSVVEDMTYVSQKDDSGALKTFLEYQASSVISDSRAENNFDHVVSNVCKDALEGPSAAATKQPIPLISYTEQNTVGLNALSSSSNIDDPLWAPESQNHYYTTMPVAPSSIKYSMPSAQHLAASRTSTGELPRTKSCSTISPNGSTYQEDDLLFSATKCLFRRNATMFPSTMASTMSGAAAAAAGLLSWPSDLGEESKLAQEPNTVGDDLPAFSEPLRDRMACLEYIIPFSREDETLLRALAGEITRVYAGSLRHFCTHAIFFPRHPLIPLSAFVPNTATTAHFYHMTTRSVERSPAAFKERSSAVSTKDYVGMSSSKPPLIRFRRERKKTLSYNRLSLLTSISRDSAVRRKSTKLSCNSKEHHAARPLIPPWRRCTKDPLEHRKVLPLSQFLRRCPPRLPMGSPLLDAPSNVVPKKGSTTQKKNSLAAMKRPATAIPNATDVTTIADEEHGEKLVDARHVSTAAASSLSGDHEGNSRSSDNTQNDSRSVISESSTPVDTTNRSTDFCTLSTFSNVPLTVEPSLIKRKLSAFLRVPHSANVSKQGVMDVNVNYVSPQPAEARNVESPLSSIGERVTTSIAGLSKAPELSLASSCIKTRRSALLKKTRTRCRQKSGKDLVDKVLIVQRAGLFYNPTSHRGKARRISRIELKGRNTVRRAATLLKYVSGNESPPDLSSVVLDWGIEWWSYSLDEMVSFFIKSIDKFDLVQSLNINFPDRLKHFFFAIAGAYHADNPYHNFFHGIQVYHAAWLLLSRYGFGKYLKPVELFGTLIGALCHDVDHPGLNNDFFIAIEHPSAICYNDVSILENHHCAFTFRILGRFPELDFRNGMTEAGRRAFRRTFIRGVLATDMQSHSVKLGNFFNRVQRHNFETELLSCSGMEDRNTLAEIVVHAADISNPLTPDPYFRRWASLIVEEFNLQCDREVALGLEPTPFMNCRTEKTRIDCQIGFVEFIVLPMWRTLLTIAPDLKSVVEQGEKNAEYWHCCSQSCSTFGSAYPSLSRNFTFRLASFQHLHPKPTLKPNGIAIGDVSLQKNRYPTEKQLSKLRI